MGFGLMFNIFPILFGLIFLFVIGVFVSSLVKKAKRERKNDASPRLSVEATVVAKRTQVDSHYHGGTDTTMSRTIHSTSYFATFQVPSGDRMELQLEGYDYGMLAEGDRGTLRFQGSRFLGFDRA